MINKKIKIKKLLVTVTSKKVESPARTSEGFVAEIVIFSRFSSAPSAGAVKKAKSKIARAKPLIEITKNIIHSDL